VQQKKGRGRSSNFVSSVKRDRRQNSSYSKEESINEVYNEEANHSREKDL
jgi:hypothetical protein